jgi:hypothetical protein
VPRGSGPHAAVDAGGSIRGAARLLDFGKLVALLFLATLHHVADDDDPAAAVARYLPARAPGSYLVMRLRRRPSGADWRPQVGDLERIRRRVELL